jgi:hypothetical protein
MSLSRSGQNEALKIHPTRANVQKLIAGPRLTLGVLVVEGCDVPGQQTGSWSTEAEV